MADPSESYQWIVFEGADVCAVPPEEINEMHQQLAAERAPMKMSCGHLMTRVEIESFRGGCLSCVLKWREEQLAAERALVRRLWDALEQIGNDPITFDEVHKAHEGTRWRACQELARAALRLEREESGE